MLLSTYHSPYRNGRAHLALLDRTFGELARPVTARPAVAYDLVQSGEDAFRLELPVPGYAEADLTLETKERTLTVVGNAPATVDGETVVHRGVARGGFEHRFTLGTHVEVTGARLVNGVLVIDLAREVPDAQKPRTIAIGRAN